MAGPDSSGPRGRQPFFLQGHRLVRSLLSRPPRSAPFIASFFFRLSIGSVRRFFLTIFLLAALAALAAGAGGLWWVHQPLKLPAPNVDLSVEPGTTPRGIAQAVADAGVAVDPQLLYLWFRISGQDRQMRAGSYELDRGVTPKLHSLVTGGSGSDEEFVYCALLVVRAAKPAATSKILFKLSSNSYYAVRKRENSVCLLALRVPR